ncbi:uncharacterized protein LOC117103332 [Anneissia japonica]|uniref:uncharacterized protein LOC117103332 n=1 Tax=Anneissia japonica TaxID=1529436 RepID=UPI0014255C80|nr:uncharacterized protein LOC117103332 [Anneissia japonica]
MEVRHIMYLLIVVIGLSSFKSAASATCSDRCNKRRLTGDACAKLCGRIYGKRQTTLSENSRWMDKIEEVASEVPEEIEESSLLQHFYQLRPQLQRIVYQVILELEISQMEG